MQVVHKLYTWFGKNELWLYLRRAKISLIGGGAAPACVPYKNTPMAKNQIWLAIQ